MISTLCPEKTQPNKKATVFYSIAISVEICGEKKRGRKREGGQEGEGKGGGRKRGKEEKGEDFPHVFSPASGSFHAAEKLLYTASYLCQILTDPSN